MPARAVDGQDADALVADLAEEFAAVRATGTPRFVEVKTYRYVGHSRSDTAPYRRPGELDEWLERDPLAILGDRLVSEGVLTPEERVDLERRVGDDVERAVEVAKASSAPDPAAMFAHVFADPR
jgi:pyruvate dehydrogenase E1 component alpha subunit